MRRLALAAFLVALAAPTPALAARYAVGLQKGAQRSQDNIARFVTKAVVDLLEAIDIHHDQAHALVKSRSPMQLSHQ